MVTNASPGLAARIVRAEARRDTGTSLEGDLDSIEAWRQAWVEVERAQGVAGLATACRACGHDPARTCCAQAHESVERACDEDLLLLNLLLGARLPAAPARSDACYFLGDHGCLLAARPALCVEFICEPAAAGIPGAALTELRWRERRYLEAFMTLLAALREPRSSDDHAR